MVVFLIQGAAQGRARELYTLGDVCRNKEWDLEHQKARPYNLVQERIANFFIILMTLVNRMMLRVSSGKLGRTFFGTAPVLELISIGRKSGKQRVAPVVYLEQEEKIIIVASRGGLSENPSWYFNVSSNPEVEVRVSNRVRKMFARQVDQNEKEVLWPELVELFPGF